MTASGGIPTSCARERSSAWTSGQGLLAGSTKSVPVAIGMPARHACCVRRIVRAPLHRRGLALGSALRAASNFEQTAGRVEDRALLRHCPVEAGRSEEHTSELQSLMSISYAVFCLQK